MGDWVPPGGIVNRHRGIVNTALLTYASGRAIDQAVDQVVSAGYNIIFATAAPTTVESTPARKRASPWNISPAAKRIRVQHNALRTTRFHFQASGVPKRYVRKARKKNFYSRY